METWKHGDIDVETWKHGEMEKWRHGDWRHDHGDMDMETSNKEQKTKAQAIFLILFTVCSTCKWKCVLCLVDEEQTEVVCLKID
jgi:hypothetical protein